MSVQATSKENLPPASRRWRLWVDGCGGFLLLSGDRWSVGGYDAQNEPDVCVRADWPRRAGEISREGGDFFWQPSSHPLGKKQLLHSGDKIPVPGSATMTLHCPNPLSTSARLDLSPPHRFEGHVDSAILVKETLLIGDRTDCHIRQLDCSKRVILVLKADVWSARIDGIPEVYPLPVGERFLFDTLAITLEQA